MMVVARHSISSKLFWAQSSGRRGKGGRTTSDAGAVFGDDDSRGRSLAGMIKHSTPTEGVAINVRISFEPGADLEWHGSGGRERRIQQAGRRLPPGSAELRTVSPCRRSSFSPPGTPAPGMRGLRHRMLGSLAPPVTCWRGEAVKKSCRMNAGGEQRRGIDTSYWM